MNQRIAMAVVLAAACSTWLGCGSGTQAPTAQIAGGDPASVSAPGETPLSPVSLPALPPLSGSDVILPPPTLGPAPELGLPGPAPTLTLPPSTSPGERPEVTIRTSLGDIRVALFADKAPVTVHNFLTTYVASGFYDKTIVHFSEKGYLIAAGGFGADGQAKPTQPPIRNESGNGLSNKRGMLAMAREAEYADSATSQFFIHLADNPSLDFKNTDEGPQFGYCVFGEVVAGLEVAEKIAETPVNGPQPGAVTIESIRRTK